MDQQRNNATQNKNDLEIIYDFFDTFNPCAQIQGIDLLEKRLGEYKDFLSNIQQLQQKFINRIRKERYQSFSKILFRQFQGEQIFAIEEIFLRKNIGSIKGVKINEIFQKLRQQRKYQQSNNNQVKDYERQLQNIYIQIRQIRNGLTRKNPLMLLKESIIFNEKQNEEKKFILDCLQNPKQLKLLFRASQHQFSAEKFYKYCDNVKNVLVLARTQFGKIIGGYNPIGWNSRLEGRCSTDSSQKAFIFSADHRQKMSLVKPEYAIYNSKNYGPIFGFIPNHSYNSYLYSIQHDICISDKCDKLKSSIGFPKAYNFSQREHLNLYKTRQEITGSKQERIFIVEYQVFLVIQ